MPETYWERRNQGLRGQGDYPLTGTLNEDLSLPPSFRKQSRKKITDSKNTKHYAKKR